MNKIGVFSVNEDFSQALIHKINGKKLQDVKAEFALVGETILFEKSHYRVIVDRLSFYVEYFKNYFKNAALMGSYVINNPYQTCVSDRLFNYDTARKMGMDIPRTICLPSHEQHPACSNEDLKNLKYPLNWEDIADFIGFPAILKPYEAFGYRDVYKVKNIPELIQAYNGTGQQPMILQEFIKFDMFIKIFVVGQKDILVVRYDQDTRGYVEETSFETFASGQQVIDNALEITKKHGFDFAALEFALKGEVPYAVNFINPSPSCRPETLSQKNFDWLVEKLADFTVEKALGDDKNIS